MGKILISESQFDYIKNYIIEQEETEVKNLINNVNSNLTSIGENPVSEGDVAGALQCQITMPPNLKSDEQKIIVDVSKAIKNIKSPKQILSTIKQVKEILRRKNEQIETVAILGIHVPIIGLYVVGGFILVLLLIKLLRSVFSGRSRTIVRRNPGCRKSRRFQWQY
jgi:hypothetical protein